MTKHLSVMKLLFFLLLFPGAGLGAEQAGGIRGMVYDKDFDAPLGAAQITIAETQQKITATDEGNYVFGQVEPGNYTLVFSKDGYTRQVKSDVVVSPGQMTEVDAWLGGEFTEMEEFVVQDVQIGTGTEAALLDLRMESPALMDSVSAELMSQAGASDAASALRLVAGASVQDGKYATVRGLPDRYVNSQMNGVRLPTADADKRAVQLDQFPAAVIDSIQVSKTFTPDQQGDASGGAVNIVLKGIPEETGLSVGSQYSWNTQVRKAGSDFLTYDGGGVNRWGFDDGDRDIQYENLGQNWDGAAGVSRGDPQTAYKGAVSGGGRQEYENFKIGAFGSTFYERDAAYYDDGIDHSYFWNEENGSFRKYPEYSRGSPDQGEFKTALFDTTQGSESVQWGGMGLFGLETENHTINFLYMYTQNTEDTATLAEDTTGKKNLYTYWPEIFTAEQGFDRPYDPYDPTHPANDKDNLGLAPYLRMETLDYTERSTDTFQLNGRHTLPSLDWQIGNLFMFDRPELDWTVAQSSSSLWQSKRLFSTEWRPGYELPGFPQWGIPSTTVPATYLPYKPASNFNFGNYQLVWKDIEETSDQYFTNLKLPYEQWSGEEGYLKFGLFGDQVDRTYDQDSFSNFGQDISYEGDWFADSYSEVFPTQDIHQITASDYDVDYEGQQEITAWYTMADLPLNSWLSLIGGARFETTELSITPDPEPLATWIPPDSTTPIQFNPGDARADINQEDALPSIGFELNPWEPVTFRGSYSETVARQTFKELSPIQQMEYLGSDVFIGNPDLQMAAIKNYDLRLDWTPYEGGLLSLSYFTKDLTDPIEYVQKYSTDNYPYTTPKNYPEGELSGYEIEMRQKMDRFWQQAEGLTLGANATLIDSEVTLPKEEADFFTSYHMPMTKRDMMNAPEHLYNFFVTYELKQTGTQLGLFYTIRGDTLVAGAGQKNGKPIFDVYETEYGTLNFSLSQKLGEIWKFKFQAKNLLDPEVETVYRSDYIAGDVRKTSYTKGMDFSFSLSAEF